MWNIALDGNGNPKLPGTDSCGGPGCRPLITVNSDGSYSYNQECKLPFFFLFFFSGSGYLLKFFKKKKVYSMAQASKAIIPKDVGGPFGRRIGVSVGGSLDWSLRVGAYVTDRVSSSDWLRYSIVVMNCKFSFSSLPLPKSLLKKKKIIQGMIVLLLLGILFRLRLPSSFAGNR